MQLNQRIDVVVGETDNGQQKYCNPPGQRAELLFILVKL